MKELVRLDMKGIPFQYQAVVLDCKELSKIIHEINNEYHTKYIGKEFAIHRSLDLYGNYCIYYFEIHGFGDYNIIEKVYD